MKQFSVTGKLKISLTILVFLTALTSAITFYEVKKVHQAYSKSTELNLIDKNLNYLLGMITNNTLGYMDAIVDKDSGDVDQTIVSKHHEFKKYIDDNKEKLTKNILVVNPTFNQEEFFTKIAKYWTAGDGMIGEIKKKKIDELGKYDDDIDGINEDVQGQVSTFLELSEKAFKDSSTILEETITLIITTTVVSCILIVLIGILIVYIVSKSINNALSTSGEILVSGAQVVLNRSKDFAELGVMLKDSTNKQAASLQESVSAIDEIKATVDRNAELSRESVTISDFCVSATQKGKSAIEEMVHSVKDIEASQQKTNTMLELTTKEIKEMVEVIRSIGQKTDIINDIVFQTKLLSFNASVEAARAGEHGKGFAVVAEEVGNLATMSGNAAKEINDMLNNSILKVEKIVSNTEKSTQELNRDNTTNVELGVRNANSCDKALAEIYQNVITMKEMITEINASSSEQAQGISSIQIALNELDRITNDNVSSADQCAKTANELNDQSEKLKGSVDHLFKEIVG